MREHHSSYISKHSTSFHVWHCMQPYLIICCNWLLQLHGYLFHGNWNNSVVEKEFVGCYYNYSSNFSFHLECNQGDVACLQSPLTYICIQYPSIWLYPFQIFATALKQTCCFDRMWLQVGKWIAPTGSGRCLCAKASKLYTIANQRLSGLAHY